MEAHESHENGSRDPAGQGYRGQSHGTLIRPDRLLPGPGLLVSRGLVYLSLLFLAAGGVWATLTELDIVVEARGRITVEGEPVRITAPEAALVLDVAVRVGERVEEGAVLLRLDALAHRSEAERVEAEIGTLRVEAARHREAARSLAAGCGSIEAELGALGTVEELARAELGKVETLRRDGIVAAADVERARQVVAETTARIARARGELTRSEREARETERLAVEAETRIAGLEARIARLRECVERATLRAPVAGVVTQLAVRHPGSVIGTAEPAAVIEPAGRRLLAAIEIPNGSMRRLRPGMAVRLAVEAFPRQDHGGVEGRLVEIEPDANAAGMYGAWVSLEREEVRGAGLLASLRPGLAVRARIVVEERRVSEFLLEPFRELGDELSVSGG